MYLILRLFVCFSVCLFLFFFLFVMIFSCFVFYRWFIDSERPSMCRQVTSSKLSNDFLKSNVYSRPSFSLFSYKDDLQVYMRQTFFWLKYWDVIISAIRHWSVANQRRDCKVISSKNRSGEKFVSTWNAGVRIRILPLTSY